MIEDMEKTKERKERNCVALLSIGFGSHLVQPELLAHLHVRRGVLTEAQHAAEDGFVGLVVLVVRFLKKQRGIPGTP